MGSGPKVGSTATGALGGAKIGASLGSMVPGVGNLVGAGVGAVAGGLGGYFMGSGGPSNDNSGGVPSAPSATPQNSYNYLNGNLTSSAVYNPSKNGYVTNAYMSPGQQDIQSLGETGIKSSLRNMQSAVAGLNGGQIKQYTDAYMQPQITALNNAYNDAYGTATNLAGANGTLGSVGFDRYLGNNIERNRAQGLADIQANGVLAGYQLPSLVMAPYEQQQQMYQSALQGANGTIQQQQQPSFTGLQAGQNASQLALNNYQNQLMQFQLQQPYRSFYGALNGNGNGGSI